MVETQNTIVGQVQTEDLVERGLGNFSQSVTLFHRCFFTRGCALVIFIFSIITSELTHSGYLLNSKNTNLKKVNANAHLHNPLTPPVELCF